MNRLTRVLKVARTVAAEYAPELAIAIGVTGLWTAIGCAIKATPQAQSNIQEEIEKQNEEIREAANENEQDQPQQITTLPAKDVARVTWKCYLPTIILASASTLCIVGGSSVRLKRNAALVTAYSLSETMLKEYQDKVTATIGEKKEKEIRESITQDRMDKNPPVNKEIIITGDGTTRCFDTLSGRYFDSSVHAIKSAAEQLNRQMRNDMYITLNEFYSEIGLPETEIGKCIGWDIDDGYIELSFSSHLSPDNVPCLAIDYDVMPKWSP